MVERFIERVAALWDSALAQPRELITLRLSLLLLLLYGPEGGVTGLATRVLALPMLLSGPLTLHRGLWTALVVVGLAETVDQWYIQDNHRFLIFYWTVACCLAVWSRDADRALAWNGRLLVSLAFTFAVLWKLLGGEIVSGELFEYAFLVDARFATLTTWAAGLEPEALEANRQTHRLLAAFPAEGFSAALRSNPRVDLAALVMGWMMVGVEASLMLAFWRSFRRPQSELHDWILIAFCVFTYTLTPVVGFGFALAVMGFAQCDPAKRDVRQAYVWTVILVQFAAFPFLDFIAAPFR